MTSSEPIPGTRAVQRVLSLLRVFSQGKSRLSLTELSEATGLSKATAHRMLSTLEREGFLVRASESSEFQLGPEMIVLGARALEAVDLRSVARPELRRLAETTGADASLEALVGNEVLILDEERGRGLMGLTSEVGTRWPAHATATGKVLLAYATEPLTEPEGGLAAVTSRTITRWEDLLVALSEARENQLSDEIEANL